MKHSIAGVLGISAFLIAAPLGANAADLAVKAPPPAPVVYDWTGFYLDVGAGWQDDHFKWTYYGMTPVPDTPFSMSHGTGSITGHIGYQQQFGWLVVGAEIGAFRPMEGNWASVTSPGGAPGCFNAVNYRCRASIDSTSLAGGKLGVDWGDWLVYAVGGVAFDTAITTQIVNPAGALFDFGASQNTHGWYVGGGFDYMMLKTRFGDLIGGVEYEHVQLAGITTCSFIQAGNVVTGTICPTNIASAFNASRTVSATEDAVWAKLTLKFNPFN